MRWKYLQLTVFAAVLAGAVVMVPVRASAEVPALTSGQISDLVTVGIDGTKAGPSYAAALARAAGGILVNVGGAGTPTPVAVVRVPKGESPRAALQLRREGAVAWAEPDTRLHSDAEPNDPCY